MQLEVLRNPQKRNKYNAERTEYAGRWYDSKKEAAYSRYLDTLRRAHKDSEKVVLIEYQVPYPIHINEIEVFKYVLDFKVTYANNHIEYFDVKGYKKGPAYELFKLKARSVQAQYGIEIKEI